MSYMSKTLPEKIFKSLKIASICVRFIKAFCMHDTNHFKLLKRILSLLLKADYGKPNESWAYR